MFLNAVHRNLVASLRLSLLKLPLVFFCLSIKRTGNVPEFDPQLFALWRDLALTRLTLVSLEQQSRNLSPIRHHWSLAVKRCKAFQSLSRTQSIHFASSVGTSGLVRRLQPHRVERVCPCSRLGNVSNFQYKKLCETPKQKTVESFLFL